MNKSLVVIVVGADRPGLVESLSRVIAGHGGNWVKSRMTTLAGQFAGLVWVMVPMGQAEALEAGLVGLEAEGLRVMVQSAEGEDVEPARLLEVELVGHDRPGIVRELAGSVKRCGVNVEELSSESVSAPMSGELLFRGRLELGVPADVDLEAVQRDLEAVAEQLGLDLSWGKVQQAG